jgi:TPR repeat protein
MYLAGYFMKNIMASIATLAVVLSAGSVNAFPKSERIKSIESLAIQRLEVTKTCEYKTVWKDSGSGADKDVVIFIPTPKSDYFAIGGFATNSPKKEKIGCVTSVKPDSKNLTGSRQLLANPIDWKLIWTDKGSGAKADGSVWNAVPPNKNFVCLGSVGQSGYGKPNLPNFRCVNTCLVEQKNTSGVIWTDAGSGADKNLSLYKIPNIGSFIAVSKHGPGPNWYDLKTNPQCMPTEEEYQIAVSTEVKKLGYLSKSHFKKANKGGFINGKEFYAAKRSGFSTRGELLEGKKGGFDNATDLRMAKKVGVTNLNDLKKYKEDQAKLRAKHELAAKKKAARKEAAKKEAARKVEEGRKRIEVAKKAKEQNKRIEAAKKAEEKNKRIEAAKKVEAAKKPAPTPATTPKPAPKRLAAPAAEKVPQPKAQNTQVAALAPRTKPGSKAASKSISVVQCSRATKHSHVALSGKCSDAYAAGDYANALSKWEPLAKIGIASAQFNLGQLYLRGQGVPKDYKAAVKWYTLAAKQGIANAQNNLANRYRRGQGVPKDYKAAVKWYRLAAKQGNASAQNNLANRYRRGQGVPKDYKSAVKWYTLAAEQGYFTSQYILGLMYSNSSRIKSIKVRMCRRTRTNQRVPTNQHCVQWNGKTAIKWYKLAAEQKVRRNKSSTKIITALRVELGELYRSGRIDDATLRTMVGGQSVPRDMAEATKWYLLAAEQNDPTAEFYLGVLAKDEATKLKWLRLSVKHGGGFRSKEALAEVERPIARKAAAKENAKPKNQLKTKYGDYLFVESCYDIRKKYLLTYIDKAQMAAAKVSIKEVENHYKSKYKNIDTNVAWEQASAEFEKKYGLNFRTMKSMTNYNAKVKGGCQLVHLGLTSFRAPGAKAKTKKKNF